MTGKCSTVRIVITDHVGNTHFSIGKAKYRLTPSIFLCKGQVGTIGNLIGELLRLAITISVITILTVPVQQYIDIGYHEV
jgi:hypothetical protein